MTQGDLLDLGQQGQTAPQWRRVGRKVRPVVSVRVDCCVCQRRAEDACPVMKENAKGKCVMSLCVRMCVQYVSVGR